MYQDSDLRQIESSLERHRDEQKRLRRTEAEIREREQHQIQKIQLDSRRDLDRIALRIKEIEREIKRMEDKRTNHLLEMQRQMEKESRLKNQKK